MLNSIINRFKSKHHKKGSYVFKELQSILNGERLNVADVGGAVNLQPHFHKLIGNSNFFIYEPDVRSYNDLVAGVGRYTHPSEFNYINSALSGKNGTRTLYLSNVPTGTSILKLKENGYFSSESSYFFPMKEVEIDTITLQHSLDQQNVNLIDVIKLDVQGAELEILMGLDAGRLAELNAVEMEIGLHEVYQDQTTFCAVEKFMQANGFSLYDVRANRSHLPNIRENVNFQQKYFNTNLQTSSIAGRLWEFDVIFIREPNWTQDHNISLKRIRRIIAIYCLYNFYIDAVYTAELALKEKKINEDDFVALIKEIVACEMNERKTLTRFEKNLKKNNYQTWGQYMWVPYPSN